MNEEKEKTLLLEEDLKLESTSEEKDSEILFEDISKRTENAKHFRMKNGHYMAAIYGQPVHYKDSESGEFKDFAERFQEKDDSYEVDAGNFRASFPKKEGKAKFIRMEKNDTSVSWRYLPKASKRKNPLATLSRKEKQRPTDLPKFPQLKYEKEDTNTDLEYSVSNYGVKENIILAKCPKNPTFRFELKLDGLRAVLSEDKKNVKLISLKSKSESPTFTIPPITMMDAAGAESEDAHYELAEEEGMTVLSVCVTPEWLSAPERIYPVIVDPQVTIIEKKPTVHTMMHLRSDGAKFKDPNFALVGRDAQGLENHIYTKFDLPGIPLDAKFKRAVLSLRLNKAVGSDTYEFYKIRESWNINTISWSNDPLHSTSPFVSIESKDYKAGDSVDVDISPFMITCYNNANSNNGIVIKKAQNTSCSATAEGSLEFYTNNGSTDYGPVLTIEYEKLEDYIDHQRYESFDVGSSGVGGVNLYNGQLIYCFQDLSFSGGKLPLQLSHLYRSEVARSSDKTIYGRGWFLSEMQTLELLPYNGIKAVYRDAQGRTHYFNEHDQDDSGCYHDFDGLGLSFDGVGTIKDEKGNTMYFQAGRLKKISDACEKNSYEITYRASKLKTITDSMGRTLTCNYNNSNKLDSVSYPISGETTYSYTSSGNLEQITRNDGSYTRFSYSGTSTDTKLVCITDSSGIYFNITYDSSGRVSSIKKYGAKSVNNGQIINCDSPIFGGGMNFIYHTNSTIVEDCITNIRTVYRFNDHGYLRFSYEDLRNCSSVNQEKITPSQFFEYEFLKTNATLCQTKGRYPSLQAAISGTSEMHPNYIKNSGFSNPDGTIKPDNWVVSLGSDSCYGDCSDETSLIGGAVVSEGVIEDCKSYKLDNTDYNHMKSLYQEIDLTNLEIKGNVLIASMWVKVPPLNPYEFMFSVKLYYSQGSSYIENGMSPDSSISDWQHIAVPLEFEKEKRPSKVSFKVSLSGKSGYGFICNPCLTETQGVLTNIEYLSSPETQHYFTHGVYHKTGEDTIQTLTDVDVYRKITTYNGHEKTVECYDKNNDKVIVDLEKFGEHYKTYIHYNDQHLVEDIEDYYGLNAITEYNEYGYNKATYVNLVDFNKPDYWDYRIYTEPDIDDSSGLENSSIDACGVNTEFLYDELCNITERKIVPFCCKYEYNEKNNLLKKVFSGEVKNEFNYNSECKYLTSISQNNYNYKFDYSFLGSVAKVSAGDEVLVKYSRYNSDPYIVNTIYETDTEGNQKNIRISYDALGNPTKKQINGTTVSTAVYDSRGNVRQIVDKPRNLCYTYEYNKDGSVKKVVMSEIGTTNSYVKEYTYDSTKNRLSKIKDFTGTEYSPIYRKIEKREVEQEDPTLIWDPQDTTIGVEVVGKFKDETELDPLGRPKKQTLTLASQSTPFLTDTYKYQTFLYENGNTSALALVGEQKQEYRVVENGKTSTKTAVWNYTYDAESDEYGNILYNTGNIKCESGTGISDVEYTYDNLNRLIQEKRGNQTTSVTYDDYGNILTKNFHNGTSYTLGYGEGTTWKDLLTSIDGTRVYYDGCHNPIQYRGFFFEWDKIRRLTWCRNTAGNTLVDTTFAYGADGIRYRKNNIYYTLDGNRILKEHNQDTGKTITYLYGQKGIVGFNYDGNDYYYRKDFHGDVLAIYNTNGKVVATYQYDAWGKVLSAIDKTDLSIANINPIRYRSYYYDIETGFYYLESRYYDPEIGRFLNPDTIDYLGDGEDLKNYNLFAYCGNNPVMYSDPTGHVPFFVVSALVLGVLGAAVGGWIAHETDNNVWAGIGIGFAVGAITGAAIGIAVSYSATGTATASFTDIRFGYALKAAQKGDYSRLAKFATHNKRSRKVGLGKYIKDSPNSYEALSKANKYSYYELKPKYWEKMKAILEEDTWEVNRTFLDQQVVKGKSFVKLSNNYTGDYYRELEHLGLL